MIHIDLKVKIKVKGFYLFILREKMKGFYLNTKGVILEICMLCGIYGD
jgi:hypothetical protein